MMPRVVTGPQRMPTTVRAGGVPAARHLRSQPRAQSAPSSPSPSDQTAPPPPSGSGARRAVVICPGLGNSGGDYLALAEQLRARGLAVKVADVARVDWLRNAAGLRDPSYWRGTLKPRPTVDWYLNKLDSAVEEAKRETDGAPITLLAHSAGGWLSRVYLLDYGTQGIDRLVSLGSPHQPPPVGVVDQTRGILTYCSQACPGTHHPEVSYVTVAGKYILGAPLRGGEQVSLQQRVVGLGYQQVCGEAGVWGDGVVPLPSAHLEGALNIDLDGVYHSPLGSVDEQQQLMQAPAGVGGIITSSSPKEVGSTIGSGGRPWYGSPSILDQWVEQLAADPSVELLATAAVLAPTAAAAEDVKPEVAA